MKLIKISEPRIGFIYDKGGDLFFVMEKAIDENTVKTQVYNKSDSKKNNSFHDIHPFCIFNGCLIGSIGITHELQNGKLVKIPRGDIEVDYVFKNKEDSFFVSNITNQKVSIVDKLGQVHVWDMPDFKKMLFKFNFKHAGSISCSYEVLAG